MKSKGPTVADAQRNTTESDRLDAACLWAARASGEDMDWAGFTAWLEADPRNAAAYDQVVLAQDRLAAAPASSFRPRVLRPRRRLGWSVGGAAAAAALAAAILLPVRASDPAPVTYSAAPDATRQVMLASGAQVTLDRGAQIVADATGLRIDLTRGAAYFAVDGKARLAVAAGDLLVRDLGTRFDVARSPTGVSVGVSQGRVAVSRRGVELAQVAAGQRLTAAGSARVVVSPVAAADVASWRDGVLRYQDAPLSVVAADISRYSGRMVTPDPRVADLRFSGALEIGDGSRLVERLEQFLPVVGQPGDAGEVLAPRRPR